MGPRSGLDAVENITLIVSLVERKDMEEIYQQA
jgi:hypothetical protein